MANAKTNAQRILEKEKIPYTPHSYTSEDGKIDGVAVAQKVGMPVEKVFKTLVTRGTSKGIFVFVIPVALELDLKAAAKAVGEKSVGMVQVKELLGLTGYIRGGVSPIGMKKKYPTYIESTCMNFDKVAVSAGICGCTLMISPADLITACDAKLFSNI